MRWRAVGRAVGRAVAVALWGMAAGAAQADGPLAGLLTEGDAAALAQFDQRRALAIEVATGTPSAEDRATLARVLAGQVLPFDAGFDPTGPWRCRTLKLGGLLELTVYGWFDCRITDDGAGWVLQKTTGSQRSLGRFYQLDETRLVYLGAQYFADQQPVWYGDDPARNQMAVAVRLADGRLRLEFPAPLAESWFDILELARR